MNAMNKDHTLHRTAGPLQIRRLYNQMKGTLSEQLSYKMKTSAYQGAVKTKYKHIGKFSGHHRVPQNKSHAVNITQRAGTVTI